LFENSEDGECCRFDIFPVQRNCHARTVVFPAYSIPQATSPSVWGKCMPFDLMPLSTPHALSINRPLASGPIVDLLYGVFSWIETNPVAPFVIFTRNRLALRTYL